MDVSYSNLLQLRWETETFIKADSGNIPMKPNKMPVLLNRHRKKCIANNENKIENKNLLKKIYETG